VGGKLGIVLRVVPYQNFFKPLLTLNLNYGVFVMTTADYTGIATAITDEIAVVAPVVLPVFGTVLAIWFGLKFVKRFIKSA